MLKEMLSRLSTSGGTLVKRFQSENSGAAAIEFAFIAPLLITMYLGTMEVSQGLEINKKVARSAGVIGDLLGQKAEFTKSQLHDLMAIGQSMLLPYNRSEPTITISFISIGADLLPKVTWSRRGVGTTYSMPYAANSAATVPANLKIANTYLIRVQTEIEYLPITSWTIQKNKGGGTYAAIDMSETYHLRPRVADTITCTDC